MTRTERIRKLALAIKDYRGSYNSQTGKWIRAPRPGVIVRMTKWLERLDADVLSSLHRIDAFETVDDMHKFLKELETAMPSTHKPNAVIVEGCLVTTLTGSSVFIENIPDKHHE